MDNRKKVSVIIMTLNAQQYIKNTIEILLEQTVMPDEIIVADSESDDKTVSIASEYERVRILNIRRDEFDHGGSRDLALRQTDSDYVLFLTQDAVIEQTDYIEKLIRNFDDDTVAMVCARQAPKPDAWPYEKLVREFNYPPERRVRTKEDIDTLGIKAFYMSDACSAYRRDIYLELGGFEHPLLTNEDMLIAARALMKGYRTVYDPQAYVLHSHNFSCRQEYRRNFDVAAFMKMHEDVFSGIVLEGEGMKLVKYVSADLLRGFHFIWLFRFAMICAAKYAGNLRGRKYYKIKPDKMHKYSQQKNFWREYFKTNVG